MQYVLIGGGALLALMVAMQFTRNTTPRKMARMLRWVAGGLLAAMSLLFVMRGAAGLATFTGPVAYMILRYGRIGNFSFEGVEASEDNESTVKSRFIAMTLDHDTGAVSGRVVAGRFKGRDLFELDEDQVRLLLDEVARDSDSLALLETWLDKNRAGWREHFGGTAGNGAAGADAPAADPVAEAYEILGLRQGAGEDEIRAAHKRLMMGVHPDQGGSTYLAARINAAKDRLLKTVKR
ncbi:MAG TPA: DnaJ domain-containing protein [Devosia sp.]|nr:DnaJ domain-containing protein [Devosia sp.]